MEDDDGMESLDFARSKVANLSSEVEQLKGEKGMLVDSLSEAHRALQEARKLLHEKGIDFPGDLPMAKRGTRVDHLGGGDPSREKWHQELEGAQHVIQDLQAQNRMLDDKLGAAKSQLEGSGIDPDIVLELQKSKAREAELLTELSVMQSVRDELIAKEQRREEAVKLSNAGESLDSANFTVESLQSKVVDLEATVEGTMHELHCLKEQQKVVAPPKNQIELQSEISALKQELQAARDLLESSTRQRASAVQELHSAQIGGAEVDQSGLQSQLYEVEAGLAATKGLFEEEMALLKKQLAASRAEVARLKGGDGGMAPTVGINLTPESMDASHQLEIESQKLSLSEKRVEQLESKNREIEQKLGALTGNAAAPQAARSSGVKLVPSSTGPGGGLVTVDAAELAKLRWELKTRKKAHLAWEGERELLQGDITALKAELERIQASAAAGQLSRPVPPSQPMQTLVAAAPGECPLCPSLEADLRQAKADLQRSEHEVDALQGELEQGHLHKDQGGPSEGGEAPEGPCSKSKCSSQKTALRLEVSQLKDELAAREGTSADRDKTRQTMTNLKQVAVDAGDEVHACISLIVGASQVTGFTLPLPCSCSQMDQLQHQLNAMKLENEKLKKTAQEKWEQDKADHHSKKGKVNRIAELKVRHLENFFPS